jgi:hypothetical protein
MKNMFKSAFLIVAILLMSVTSLAIPDIELRGPVNGATTESFRIEFGYGFSSVPNDIAKCSLFVDGTQVAQRQNLFSYDNNKIGFELEEGTHTWFIRCSDDAGEEVTSDTRTITVASAIEGEEGFETIYTNSGDRIQVVILTRGVEGIGLPAMKPNDGIRFKTAKTSYDFDFLKMSAVDGKTFAELRDRKNSKLYKIFVGESLDVDLDADEEVDVRLVLDKINRGVEAFFVVQPYPGYVPVEETPVVEEEPEVSVPEEVPGETTTPVEVPVAEETPVETPVVATPTESETPAVVVSEEKKGFNWLIPLVIIIVLGAIGGLTYFLANKTPATKKEVNFAKKETVITEKKVEVKETHHAKQHSTSKQSDDNFDVIKHTTSSRRK